MTKTINLINKYKQGIIENGLMVAVCLIRDKTIPTNGIIRNDENKSFYIPKINFNWIFQRGMITCLYEYCERKCY